MKRLLDQNLSFRIVEQLSSYYSGSPQVKLLKMDTASDQQIWLYAKKHNFVIVTKDSDSHELSLLYGAPPKIIWLKCGNRSSSYISNLLIE